VWRDITFEKGIWKRGGGSNFFLLFCSQLLFVEQGLKGVSFLVVVRKKIGAAERDIMTKTKLN